MQFPAWSSAVSILVNTHQPVQDQAVGPVIFKDALGTVLQQLLPAALQVVQQIPEPLQNN